MYHLVKGKAHWMDGVDKEALDWVIDF